SAQLRQDNALVQHGSLPLTGDVTRLVSALFFDMPGQRIAVQLRLGRRAVELKTCLGQTKSFEEVSHALASGLGEALDLSFEQGDLTQAEQAALGSYREKYTSESWTKRV